jgi:polysaccharide deacetylase family sporulation protein PdaB
MKLNREMRKRENRSFKIPHLIEVILTLVVIIFLLFEGCHPNLGQTSCLPEEKGDNQKIAVAETGTGSIKPQLSQNPEKKTVSNIPEKNPALSGQTPPQKPDKDEPTPHQTNTTSAITDSVIKSNPLAGNMVALTFDDGPYPVWTAEYLELLEKYQIKATFFLVGQRVKQYPHLAQKIQNKKCEIGTHSYGHHNLVQRNLKQLEADFMYTKENIKKAVGQEPRLFRPPFGAYNDVVLEIAEKYGQKTITWNIDPRDWNSHDSNEIVYRVLSQVSGGSIVLLHEGRKSTLAALPRIIKGLREKGYEIVSVSELIEKTEKREVQGNPVT